MKSAIFAIALLCLAASCKSSGDGHGHGHGPGADHAPHGEGDELPHESVTRWTERAELFMEWEPLIVGRESRFLAHLTDLSEGRFAALAEGQVLVTVTVGSKTLKAEAKESARLGIFIPALTPDTAGPCTMRVELKAATLSESFAVGDCTIYSDEAAARAVKSDEDPPGLIGFLKEQQWPIEFATEAARRENIVPSKTVNAKIVVVPGREARLTAGTAGRLSLQTPVPTIGTDVKEGQLLARIQPTVNAPGSVGTLRADVAAAKAEYTAAKAAHERLVRLLASESVPKRRVDEAASDVEVAQARLNAASTRLSSYTASASGSSRPGTGAFQVSTPIAGTLVEQSVTEGETTAAGALLFTVVDLDRVWVEGRIFEPDVPAFEKSSAGWFTVDGRDTVFDINESTGKLITVGHVLDPKSRTVPVIFEVANPNRVLRIGQFAKLSVATGPPATALVIPTSAVLQDGNQNIVFVQVSGESFERRVVTLGTESRGLVEVLRGLAQGERVVTKGVYDVKLAASAGDAPAHGHAH